MRKNKILISIIVILSIILITNTTTGQDNKRFDKIGVYYNPTMDFINADLFHYTYSVGIRSDFRLNEKIAIKLGLGYEHIEYTRALYGDLYEIRPKFIYLDLQLVTTDFHLRFDLLNPEKLIAIYLFSGSTINTNIREKSRLNYSESNIEYYDNKNIFIHSSNISFGAGFSTKIKDKITICIEPSYSNVLWWNQKIIIRQCNNRFGLSLGIFYDL